MGWADFGGALYLNYSNAAGMLAELKLALRREERADRQVAIQEQMQKAQTAYNKAKVVLDEWVESREQVKRDEELRYKQEFFEWQKGEMARADEKRVRDAKSEVQVALGQAQNEQRVRDDAAERRRAQIQQDREQLKKDYMGLGMSEAEAEITATENVPDRVESEIVTAALNKQKFRELYPDRSEAEIREIFQGIYAPKSKEELSESVEFATDFRHIDQMEADGLDREIADGLRRGVFDRIEGARRGRDSALQEQLNAVDAEYGPEGRTPDPERHRQVRDGLLGVTPPAADAKLPTDNPEVNDIINRYAEGSDNQQLTVMLAVGDGGASAELASLGIFDILMQGRSNISEYSPEEVSVISQMIARAASEGIGGESVQALNVANRLIAEELPRLYAVYQDLKSKGHDVGKVAQIDETLAEIGGGTSNLEVGRFQREMNQLLEEFLRLGTGAVISEGEIRRTLGVPANDEVGYAVSDLLFLSLAGYVTDRAESLFVDVAGTKWGGEAARNIYKETFGIYADLEQKMPNLHIDKTVDNLNRVRSKRGKGKADKSVEM